MVLLIVNRNMLFQHQFTDRTLNLFKKQRMQRAAITRYNSMTAARVKTAYHVSFPVESKRILRLISICRLTGTAHYRLHWCVNTSNTQKGITNKLLLCRAFRRICDMTVYTAAALRKSSAVGYNPVIWWFDYLNQFPKSVSVIFLNQFNPAEIPYRGIRYEHCVIADTSNAVPFICHAGNGYLIIKIFLQVHLLFLWKHPFAPFWKIIFNFLLFSPLPLEGG